MGDVRAYALNPVRAKLLPPKKKRVIETMASSFSAVKEIEKTSPDEFWPICYYFFLICCTYISLPYHLP
ncbi:unnamed protein product [Cylicocyclus nassatus]|uniref:Uncharacterized protein n=1 Tax=Cylicocyclus nassatus TaxID=53992 RepID=A0AA36HIQ0_CYLNA|nr:unnamed protein product [Cylicocyclus nassatus]